MLVSTPNQNPLFFISSSIPRQPANPLFFISSSSLINQHPMAFQPLLFSLSIFSILIPLNSQNHPFEYFQMVEQWGPATCSETKVHCFAPPKPLFTIHGLWPSNFTNPYLPCPKGVKFDISQITTLVPQLEIHWPSLLTGKHKKFWKHEWKKHGTCSDPPLDMFNYFQTTLNIHTRYDLLNILIAAGFAPKSSEVDFSDIAKAIKTTTKKKPHLRCNENEQTKKYQLSEIVLCFADDGHLTLIDCPPLPNTCPQQFIWLSHDSLVSEGREVI